MATKVYYISGKSMYAKVYEPDEYPEGSFNWKIIVCPDEDGQETFNRSGCELRPKMYEEFGRGYQFRRPIEKEIKGKLVKFSPPSVLDANGESFPDGEQPLIGNGSDVTVKISVYDTPNRGKNSKGHRLESVRVDNLIEYTPEDREENGDGDYIGEVDEYYEGIRF